MKDIYTTAVLKLLKPDADAAKVLEGFKATLNERGHSALYAPVLRNVLRQLQAARPTTVVTVKDAAVAEKQATAIAAALAALGADPANEPVVKTDSTLVGGFITEHAHKRQDNSYKSKLVSLYRSVTQ